MNGSLRRLAAFALASLSLGAFAHAGEEPDTIAGRLAAEDRFVSTEDANGLDAFRFDQRNWYDYDILFAAVLTEGSLVPAVTSADTEVTLFAPNDRAFQLLAFNLTGRWFFTELEVVGALLDLVDQGAVNLGNVLSYHLVGQRVLRRDIPFGADVPTLNGDPLRFKRYFFGLFVRIKDVSTSFRNPFLLRTDLGAGRSVVHSISRVLIPSNVGG